MNGRKWPLGALEDTVSRLDAGNVKSDWATKNNYSERV